MYKEFKEFIARGNVVDLAVAVVIGAAFGRIVTSLVALREDAGRRGRCELTHRLPALPTCLATG